MKSTVLALSLYWVGALAKTINVSPGDSIQAAINSARQGDRIVVASGTYAEQLEIKKNGIKLVGKNAKLVPPSAFKKNECTGEAGPRSQAGICVHGGGITRKPFYSEHRKVIAVTRPVKNVLIQGMGVSNFTGANIMVIGGQDIEILNNTLIDGPTYGFLTAGSVNTLMDGNTVTSSTPEGSGFIAMCMDDFSGVVASHNTITFYVIGLCVETRGAMLQQNEVSSTCRAIFLDPFTQDVHVLDNHIGTSFPCGDFGSYGITIDGAHGAVVQRNIIKNQSSSNGPAAGVGVFDDPCSELSPTCQEVNRTAVAFGNTVTHNTFRNNDLDIERNTTGTDNRLKPNKCSTSSPPGICGTN